MRAPQHARFTDAHTRLTRGARIVAGIPGKDR